MTLMGISGSLHEQSVKTGGHSPFGQCNLVTLAVILLFVLTLLVQSANALPEIPCDGVDIRNDPVLNRDRFAQQNEEWQNCTVIEGSVYLVLMTNNNLTHDDFASIRFTNLREITGSVLIFQIEGLNSLEHFFPNLRVIRGQALIHNYALVIYQTKLHQIGLHKLALIERGGARIAENNYLCNADTLDWHKIFGVESHVVRELNQDPNTCQNSCPDNNEPGICVNAEEGRRCWDGGHCQLRYTCPKCGQTAFCNVTYENKQMKETCCHGQCVGGCVGPLDTDCYACRNVIFEGRCMESCPSGFFKYLDRRCLSAEECRNLPNKWNELGENKYWKALVLEQHPSGDGGNASVVRPSDGICTLECPTGYEEPPTNKTTCVKCSGPCKTKCKGHDILSVADAERLKSCNIVLGQLKFQVRSELHKNVVQEIEGYLSGIEEVTQYVQVTFSPSFVTLNMLKNLRVIHGEKLFNNKYALSVFENEYLTQFWNTTDRHGHKLEIRNGGLQFQNNPHLCLNTIHKFTTSIFGKEGVEARKAQSLDDISEHSNGNEAVCEETEIATYVVNVSANEVVLKWVPMNTTDMDERSFLGYKLFYKQVDSENVSITEQRDACSDTWQFQYLTPTERGGIIGNLKPHTLYAVYLTTLMINSPGSKGGISKVLYLRTKFGAPSRVSAPTAVVDNNSIRLSWEPPEHPNGVIAHYMITYEPRPDVLPIGRDYCDQPPAEVESKPLLHIQSSSQEVCSKHQCCDCRPGGLGRGDASMSEPDKKEIAAKKEKADFEDALHNFVFVAKTGTKQQMSLRKGQSPKRSGDAGVATRRRRKRDVSGERPPFANEISRADSLDDDTQSLNGVPTAEPGTGGSNQRNRRPAAADRYSPLATTTATSSPRTSGSGVLNGVPPTPKLIPAVARSIQINVTDTRYTIENLTHYREYIIRIVACQNDSAEPHYCSEAEESIVKRTAPTPYKDAINDSSVMITPTPDGGRRINFSLPSDPNGVTVAIELQFRMSPNFPVALTFCEPISKISVLHGYKVSKELLQSGDWEVRVRALSLVRDRTLVPWTTWKGFTVPSTGIPLNYIVLIAVAGSVIIIALGVMVVTLVYKKKIKAKEKEIILNVTTNPDYLTQEDFYKQDDWELRREDITLLRELGEGTFGKVYAAVGNNVRSVSGIAFGDCAVKTIRGSQSIYDVCHFLREANFMKHFHTPHVVQLYGVVSIGKPALVVMEFMEKGNLKDYLRSRRPDDAEENVDDLPPPTLQDMYQWATEIADGMAYLEHAKFCHRDLAARNCLVSHADTCKIGDFGMARDVYIKEYYRPEGRRLMPVRWMAPEALKDAKFSNKSDVWSYGVVLWELVTLACQPYQGLTNEAVIDFVHEGNVMPKPTDCPDLMYILMRMCWKKDPRERPSFIDIIEKFLPKPNDAFKTNSFYYTEYKQHPPQSGSSTSSSRSAAAAAAANENASALIAPATPAAAAAAPSASELSSEPKTTAGAPARTSAGGAAFPAAAAAGAPAAAAALNSTDVVSRSSRSSSSRSSVGESHPLGSNVRQPLLNQDGLASIFRPDGNELCDSDTPLNPEDDIELKEPVCNNNRRVCVGGMVKSISTPNNFQKAAVTPPVWKSVSPDVIAF